MDPKQFPEAFGSPASSLISPTAMFVKIRKLAISEIMCAIFSIDADLAFAFVFTLIKKKKTPKDLSRMKLFSKESVDVLLRMQILGVCC